MIKSEIDLKENKVDISAGFDDINQFAQEMGMMINTIINLTAYRGCNNDIKSGAKIAEQLKDVVQKGLALDVNFKEWVDQMAGGIDSE